MTQNVSSFLENHLEQEASILFYDGVCAVCNRSIQFLLSQERLPILLFAPLHSDLSKVTESYFNLDFNRQNSLVLYHELSIYTKSTAVLKLIPFTKWYWQVFRVLWVLPAPVRDFFYDWIALHRYSWFGKTEYCQVVSPEKKTRFLS